MDRVPSAPERRQEAQPVDLLVTGGTLVTMDSERRVFHPGSVAIMGNRIIATGPSGVIDPLYRSERKIDASGQIIMPGLVSCHGHACNSLVRGMAEDRSLHEWLTEVLWPAMSHAGPEEVYCGSLLSAVEMLRAGITCFADMWTEVPATAKAVEEVGLRALLAHNMKDFGIAERAECELERAMEAWRLCHGSAEGRVRVGLSPHSIYACSPEMLKRARALASDHGLLLQIHLSETRQEYEECLGKHGCTPVRYLDRLGFFGRNVVAAHVVWLDDDDVNVLQRHGVSVAHCVASNLKLGSGVAEVGRLQRAGIRIVLGTDGPASNNSLDLFGDMKVAALVQKGVLRTPKLMPAQEVVAMATCDGAAALGLGEELGVLAPGRLADLILVECGNAHMTPYHPDNSCQVYAHLVYCAKGCDVRTVLVDGKLRMLDRQLQGIDETRILADAQRASERILHRVGLLNR